MATCSILTHNTDFDHCQHFFASVALRVLHAARTPTNRYLNCTITMPRKTPTPLEAVLQLPLHEQADRAIDILGSVLVLPSPYIP